MDIDFINELAVILNDKNIQELEYSSCDERIRLVKNIEVKAHENEKHFKGQSDSNDKVDIASINAIENKNEDVDSSLKKDLDIGLDTEKITANMIGTFYRKPAPDEEEFVKVGSKVKKGDVIGIIESMKLLNEMKSPFDCEIKKFLADDEEVVEFGQALFEVKVI